MIKEKLYGIEYKHDYWGTKYRFYSLFNNARGGWTNEDEANKEGKNHEQIIKQCFFKGDTK